MREQILTAGDAAMSNIHDLRRQIASITAKQGPKRRGRPTQREVESRAFDFTTAARMNMRDCLQHMLSRVDRAALLLKQSGEHYRAYDITRAVQFELRMITDLVAA